jgi:hypothetical protein
MDTPVAIPARAPAHDPAERTLLTWAEGWQVRVFAETDFRYGYFARKRMLHVQLWHPRSRVSVLTPSHFTADRWELHCERMWRVTAADSRGIDRVLEPMCGVRLPNIMTLAGLEYWFVRVPTGDIDTIEIRAFG